MPKTTQFSLDATNNIINRHNTCIESNTTVVNILERVVEQSITELIGIIVASRVMNTSID